MVTYMITYEAKPRLALTLTGIEDNATTSWVEWCWYY
jgi:hypothetical protein